MGKGRKKHKPHIDRTPKTTSFTSPASPQGTYKGAFLRRLGWQLAGVIGLSALLGFSFNAANPVGVRFEEVAGSADELPGPNMNDFNLTSTGATAKYLTPTQTAAVVSPPQPTQLHSLTPTGAAKPQVAMIAPANPTKPPPPPAQVPAVAQTNSNPAPIHWTQAKAVVASGRAILVDVRPRAAYDAGHIPEAISIPETTSPAEFSAFLKQLPNTLTLIVYCSSTSCSQSQRVAKRLVQEFHWPSVKYMTGGYQEYQREELAKPKNQSPS